MGAAVPRISVFGAVNKRQPTKNHTVCTQPPSSSSLSCARRRSSPENPTFKRHNIITGVTRFTRDLENKAIRVTSNSELGPSHNSHIDPSCQRLRAMLPISRLRPDTKDKL
ncbi:hypothetical protein SERLA73DRAFT_69817 [Serpula lacrymans var. lacrymans S7.3]|uniref:Uncharacterized protein n=1 Tax=Serpula lacrymans var. lacrymans (strain S7.3) TaxID=936435 RepID=F8PLB7_SERL3|nr:hypothetical protein SERLA73DRAFT_69817 [Serpula lacrymans var. lacrymans S7.3]